MVISEKVTSKNNEVEKTLNKNIVESEAINNNIEENKIFNDIQNEIYLSIVWKEVLDGETVAQLKEISRGDRKAICEKIMNEYSWSNPVLAFAWADCLLYNGYGKNAIPLFAEYTYWPQNKEHFNWRIGYWWLHIWDGYEIWSDILSEMTWWLELAAWVYDEIYLEVYNNLDKFEKINPNIKWELYKNAFNKMQQWKKNQWFTEQQKTNFYDIESWCPKFIMHIWWFSCETVQTDEMVSCQKSLLENPLDLSPICENLFENVGSDIVCEKWDFGIDKISVQCETAWKTEVLFEN